MPSHRRQYRYIRCLSRSTKGILSTGCLASARLLEALGFLEKTVPQKLYMGEKEVRDSAGHPITIQKYQIPEYGADIREV